MNPNPGASLYKLHVWDTCTSALSLSYFCCDHVQGHKCAPSHEHPHTTSAQVIGVWFHSIEMGESARWPYCVPSSPCHTFHFEVLGVFPVTLITSFFQLLEGEHILQEEAPELIDFLNPMRRPPGLLFLNTLGETLLVFQYSFSLSFVLKLRRSHNKDYISRPPL